MPSEAVLPRLQEWMQHVITFRGEIGQAVASEEAQRFVKATELEREIIPSHSLTAEERIGVYHGMYRLRMFDVLIADYPAVVHFLGDRRFRRLADDYIEEYPSRSYTLNRLGDHFPAFIQSRKNLRQRGFLYDLARLELAMSEVFDAEEVAPFDASALAGFDADQWLAARFRVIPAVRLLELRYPVNAYFQSTRDETPHPELRREKNWLVVHRQDYSVRRLPMASEAFSFFASLRDGRTIDSAMGTFFRQFRRAPAETELFVWFREWTAAGLFSAIETA